MRITVLLLLFTLAASTATAMLEPGARGGERLPEGMGKYILVLRATSDGPRIDVTRLGGRVLHADGDRRVILLPLAAAAQVRAAGDVAYLQRVWMGEPLESWNEPDAPSRPRRLQSDSETDLTWQLGPFAYDGSGNISSTGSDSYRYDSAGRLIQAVVNGKEETYAYDSFGNLISKVTDGQSSTMPPVDPFSNRIIGEEYDVAGNLTTSKGPTPSRPKSVYQYDALGMLTKITTPYLQQRRMIYTPDDERIGNDLVGNTPDRWYVRDMNSGKVLREFSVDSGDNWLWVEDYIYNEGQLAGGERVSYHGGKRHFHLDHLGSVRMITSSSRLRFGRHDFYPFGIEQTRSIQEWENFGLVGDPGTMQRPDPMKFTSHERDFHGLVNVENTDYLDYMHARYYNPNHGRFVSVDPKNRRAPLKQPQLYNRYAYALNNPLNFVDLDGEDVKPVRVLMTGGKPKIVYVDSRMVPRLQNLVSAAHQQGVSFTFSSLLRTQQQQDAIKTTNTKNGKGTSPHTAGLAIDINVSSSLKGTDLAGLTTIARAADLSPLKNQAADPPHFQANDLITRGKDGKVDEQFIALVEENQKQVEEYEKKRLENPGEFAQDVVDILPPRP